MSTGEERRSSIEELHKKRIGSVYMKMTSVSIAAFLAVMQMEHYEVLRSRPNAFDRS